MLNCFYFLGIILVYQLNSSDTRKLTMCVGELSVVLSFSLVRGVLDLALLLQGWLIRYDRFVGKGRKV